MKDFTATNAEFESIDISEKFQISESGAIGGVIPSGVNDIIKWDGDKWIAGVNPGGSGNSGGSYVANPFSTNLISGQSIQGILFGQALDSAPSIATDLEIDGDGSIIPYTISGINTTGYTAIFAEEIPNNNYKIHTVFGGGGGGGSSSSYWQTGASDLYYNDNNVNIQRDLTIGGNLTVNGTQTIVNTETVEIEDHNLVIGANTHYTGFANPYPGAGDAYAGILWGTGDAGAASSVGLTYQSNKGFAFEGGNVGIGTTSPSARLEVQDGSQIVALFKSQSTATNAVTAIAIQSPSATSNGRTRIGADVDDLTFSTSNGASDPNSSIERMRIDSDGNVGIGTTDPGAKLEVFQDLDTSSGASILKVTNTRLNTGSSSSVISLITDEVDGNTADERVQLAGSYDGTNGGKLDILTNNGSSLSPAVTIKHNGNVGIGTTDPIRPLEVHTNSGAVYTDGASGNILRLRNMKEDTAKSHCGIDLFAGISTSTTTPHNPLARIYAVRENDADGKCALTFATRSTSSVSEVMRIDSAGNVGIGVTDPNTRLEIAQPNGNSGLTLNYIPSTYRNRYKSDLYHDGVGNLKIESWAGAATTAGDILLAPNGGNVGIGTTDPGAKLEVYNNSTSNLYPMVHNESAGNAGWRLKNNQGDWVMIANAALRFYDVGQSLERMRIDEDGNVGIGTTNPVYNLHVADATEPNLLIQRTTPNGNVSGLTLNSVGGTGVNNRTADISLMIADSAGDSEPILKFSTTNGASPGKDTMSITNGNVGIGTTDPGSYKLNVNGTLKILDTSYVGSNEITSDDRVKHNEQPIIGALETLSKITPKKYIKTVEMYEADHDFELDADGNPVDENGEPVEHRIEAGVIAQQVLTVNELAFAVSPEGVDEDGTATSPHGLDYNSLFTYAIAAIQEQQQLIEQLKSQNESLAARISALES